jgi:hypothetical protein
MGMSHKYIEEQHTMSNNQKNLKKKNSGSVLPQPTPTNAPIRPTGRGMTLSFGDIKKDLRIFPRDQLLLITTPDPGKNPQ